MAAMYFGIMCISFNCPGVVHSSTIYIKISAQFLQCVCR